MAFSLLLTACAFTPSSSKLALARCAHRPTCTMLFNADRSRRSAGLSDRKVTLAKPLGLELVTGPGNSVVIGDIIPGSNAAQAASKGLLKKGDCIVMCSATFGDAMWSTRGVGTERVMKAIAVRAGDVSIVLETPETFKSNSKAAQLADEKARQVCTIARAPHARRWRARMSDAQDTRGAGSALGAREPRSRPHRRARAFAPFARARHTQSKESEMRSLQDQIKKEEGTKKAGPFGLW